MLWQRDTLYASFNGNSLPSLEGEQLRSWPTCAFSKGPKRKLEPSLKTLMFSRKLQEPLPKERERKKEKSEIAIGINEERKKMKHSNDTEN